MSPFRMARDFKDLYKGFVDLLVIEEHNEDASYEIAASACDFTRKTQEVVDDKLNFSATLMRAGEVEAANRLLKEFHDEVREEEVALIERVNEVKAAEAVRKQGMTRVRMARMLAVAMIGSSLLSFSAAGMALAGLIKDRAEQVDDAQAVIRSAARDHVLGTRIAARSGDQGRLRPVNIGRLKLMLSMSELRTIRELAGGSMNESGLADIIGLLPDQLAEKVQDAIVIATDTVDEVTEDVKVAEVADLRAERRKARRAAAKAENEQPTPQPSETEDNNKPDEGEDGDGFGPSPDDSEDESAEEQPEAQPQDEDEGRKGDDEDGNLPPLFDRADG